MGKDARPLVNRKALYSSNQDRIKTAGQLQWDHHLCAMCAKIYPIDRGGTETVLSKSHVPRQSIMQLASVMTANGHTGGKNMEV